MDDLNIIIRFIVALCIGLMVGLQREYANDNPEVELPAGIRTFSLLSVLGCSGAMLSEILKSPAPLISILIIVGVFFAVNYIVDISSGKTGLTTKVSAMLTIIAGALTYFQRYQIAVLIGVIMTVLLSLKVETHTFAHKINREDIFATLKFIIITAIILPILPNSSFGLPPFDVLNPLKIWLFVVLISSISFVGYVLMKLIGANKGIWLIGILGGIISSTAVTISFTQKSKECEELSNSFAQAILIAWTIMFIRIVVIASVINIKLINYIWMPMIVSVFVGLPYCIYLMKSHNKNEKSQNISFTNPFELGPAIKFGILFSVIILIAKTAQMYFGSKGIYISSFFSGISC